jgi:hypothetical protein
MLLDTGAGEGYLLRCPRFKIPLVIDRRKRISVQVASGRIIETEGIVKTCIKLGKSEVLNKVELHVLDVPSLPLKGKSDDLLVVAGRRLMQYWSISIEGDGTISYTDIGNSPESHVTKSHIDHVSILQTKDENVCLLDSKIATSELDNSGTDEGKGVLYSTLDRLDSTTITNMLDSAENKNIKDVLDSTINVRHGVDTRNPNHEPVLESTSENEISYYQTMTKDVDHPKNDILIESLEEDLAASNIIEDPISHSPIKSSSAWKDTTSRDETSGRWRPIHGSRKFRIRERTLSPEEVKDTQEQSICFEVDWDDVEESAPLAQARSFDFSRSIIQKLNKDEYNHFENELNNYLEKRWWSRLTDEAITESEQPVICFPVVQAGKSTKVRPVLDCRPYNMHLSPCSYLGPDCGQILRQIRVGCGEICNRAGGTAQIVTLDLKTAFYRVRLRQGRRICIRTNGTLYSSDRVTFGTKYGPACLEAAVRALLFKASEMAGQTPWVRYYLDDITIIGHGVMKYISCLVNIASKFGFEFPPEKRHVVTLYSMNQKWIVHPFEPFSHLGVIFACKDGELVMKCKPREPVIVPVEFMTKRSGFKVAGSGIDQLWMHPERHCASDIIRRVVGSEKQWDARIDNVKLEFWKKLTDQLISSPCEHPVLLQKITTIDVDTDASDYGYGYEIRINKIPMIQRSRLWSAAQDKWHINRKEHFATIQALIMLNDFVHYADNAILCVRSDSKSSLAWLNGSTKTKSMDRICIERLNSVKDELLDMWKNSVSHAKFEKISGKNNCVADYLSRLPHVLGVKSHRKVTDPGDAMLLATSLGSISATAHIEDMSTSIKNLWLIRIWRAWRQVIADKRNIRLPANDDTATSLLKSMQQQSVAITAHIRFLVERASSGFPISQLIEQTQYRFVSEGLLYHLRFLNGDITLDPIGVIVLDTSTPLGGYVAEHIAKEVHEEFGHATVRYCCWRLSKIFFAPSIRRVVQRVIEGCSTCISRAKRHARRSGYLIQRSLDTSADSFFDVVSIDLFSIPQQYQHTGVLYVIVLVDHFSRFCLLRGLETKTAREIQSVLDDWFSMFTTPSLIRSDNSKEFKALSRMKRYNWYRIPAYSPFANGICERAMSDLNKFVGIKNWQVTLHQLQKKMNAKRIAELDLTPAQIVFGRDHHEIAENASFTGRTRDREEVRQEVLRIREHREPTRPLPVRLELKSGDMVVRTYDPIDSRTLFVVRSIKNMVLVTIEDPVSHRVFTEHIRNLKVVLEEQPGGSDVE